MYDHVLVGTDGSARATIAVKAAARLAQSHQAQLGRRSLRKALERQGVADLIVIPTSDRTPRTGRRAA